MSHLGRALRAVSVVCVLVLSLLAPIHAAVPPARGIFLLQEKADPADTQYPVTRIGIIAGASRISASADGRHLLVLTEQGVVYTWGENTQGQLGTGNVEPLEGWHPVEGLGRIVDIAAGSAHSLALAQDGTVWAWGDNARGQLGDGTLLSHLRPQQVPGLTGITSIAAAGDTSAARRQDGAIVVFGAPLSTAEQTLLLRPKRLAGLNLPAAIDIQDGALQTRQPLAVRHRAAWPGTFGLQRLVTPTRNGFELSENGWEVQQVDVKGTLVDFTAGWAIGWIEGPPLLTSDSNNTAEAVSPGVIHRMGGTAATPDLSITTTAPFPFTVGSQAGYVLTLTNVGGAATTGTITVTDTLPSGISYGGGSGTGFACQAAGQTVTCTTSDVIAAGGSVTVYLVVAVGQAAYPSVGNTTAVTVVGDANAANNSSSITQAVAAKPAIAPTGVFAGGHYHTLRLSPDGTVWATGDNWLGELGDGTNDDRSVWTRVSNLTGVAAIGAGFRHSIALKADGTVWGWGYNSYGQIGDGTITTSRNVPTTVPGFTGVVAVASGDEHLIALKSDGTVWTWGRNLRGQLGDGTTTNRSSPVRVIGLTGVVRIAGAGQSSLAIRADGTVWAWGYNWAGQLGDGTYTDRWTPVQVAGLADAALITGGEAHCLAIKTDGSMWAWGYNSSGQLGDGTYTSRSTPVSVLGLANAVTVMAGYMESIARLSDGTVWTWGGVYAQNKIPVQTAGLSGIVTIGVGGWWDQPFFFAGRSDGSALAWGDNQYGQLSTGLPLFRPIATQVPGLSNAKSLSARERSSLVVKTGGTVWAWGENRYGQTGDGTAVSPRATPVQAVGVTTASGGGSGFEHSLALLHNGTVWSWGDNSHGQLGDGTTNTRWTPSAIPGLTGITKVSAGHTHNLAIRNDGTLWAWGSNDQGEIGDGTVTTRLSPVQVPGLTGVVDAATGDTFSLVLKSDGTVWAWGDNSANQLGDGTAVNHLNASQVPGLSGVIAVSAGLRSGAALRSDGSVWVWGTFDGGGMGDGTAGSKPIPTQVKNLTGVTAISLGGQHGIALRSNGTVWTWGLNALGQLGDGTTTNRLVPVPVAQLTNVVAVEAGGDHNLAICSDGTVWAWGSILYGQVGDGASAAIAIPTATSSPGAPDLSIAMTDSGIPAAGTQSTYTITITNVGQQPTTSIITVTDSLPSGMTYASATGTNWACSAAGQVVTCTTNSVLAAGASSVITLKVNVLAAAAPAVTNIATVANASDRNAANNTTGDPLMVGLTAAVGVTPSSGSGAAQTFQAQYSGALGYQQLRWVQLLFGAATDGGGQPFCFLHYDVQGNAFWLYSDVSGFFRGPVTTGAASNELQGSHCALNTSASTVAGSGATLTLNLAVVFKAAADRNVYMRAMDLTDYDTGWLQRGTWTQAATALPALTVGPASGAGSTQTFTLTYPDPAGFTGFAFGWKQFLIAAATDGGGQPFCFLHYDRGGNGLWMYSSDVGYFVGPATPGTASNALSSSACAIDTGGTTVQNTSGNLILTVPVTLKPPMSGVKNTYLRTLDALTRDTGWQPAGTWTIP